ncbi:membrane hypothetical protein [Bradyrhizobium sp. STM 3843]|uniref:hypothetical protein n=1 Tax=Bradyrhizobium sp. STM 3843 TaxID=551947 RepID=UPI00024046B6|nr:hypothetical protein [Bradyrhizobium sp. STM 3843]CCE09846.1 membrane hypothetical protein [Bradyrhizobium sp. STM 3843]
MMFVFASGSQPHVWPVHTIHVTEVVFVASAFACLVAAMFLGTTPGPSLLKELVAVVGGIGASFGLIMPFELMPIFFNVQPGVMIGSTVLIPFYPIAALAFWALLRKAMRTNVEIDLAAHPKESIRTIRPSWQVPEVRRSGLVARPPASYVYGLITVVTWLIGWPILCVFISTAPVPNWLYFCAAVLWFVSLLALYQILLWLGRFWPTASKITRGLALLWSLLTNLGS